LTLESQLAINQGRRLQQIQLAIDEYILDDERIDDLISPLDLFETFSFSKNLCPYIFEHESKFMILCQVCVCSSYIFLDMWRQRAVRYNV